MILAVANTIGPAEGAPAGQAVRDIREKVTQGASLAEALRDRGYTVKLAGG